MNAPLEGEMIAAAARALRRRATALRKRAAPGVTVLDGYAKPVLVIASETAHALRIARDWERVARELEARSSADRVVTS